MYRTYLHQVLMKQDSEDPANPPSQHTSRRNKALEEAEEYYRQYFARERFVQLAQHKEPKQIWITSVGPRVMWGTQETLWPVSKSALNAATTERLTALATPKRNFQAPHKANRPEFMYSCGRSSVIWDVSPGALKTTPTERLEQLSQPKEAPQDYITKEDRPHYVFSCGRSSPIWTVSAGAQGADDRPRTEQLAQAKHVHPEFMDARDVRTVIPRRALHARSSERLESLSTPKNRTDGPFREPQWTVRDEAKKALASGRQTELAKHKGTVEGFIPARDVVWSVSRGARKAAASSRTEELARPIIRASMDHVQFDPDAFLVKDTALKARASRRIEELAAPITR